MTRVLVALEMYSCNGLGLMDFAVPPLAQVDVTECPGGCASGCARTEVPTSGHLLECWCSGTEPGPEGLAQAAVTGTRLA